MSQKRKVLFRISIGLNILLIVILVCGCINTNIVIKHVFDTEVQWNLIELEGLIAYQSDNNWSEPNLVTTQLGDVLDGIWLGWITGDLLGVLSNQDKEIIGEFYSELNQYPHDTVSNFVDLTKEDKEDYEELRGKLRESGWGMHIQSRGFMNQVEKFLNDIEQQPNY